jgi:hypothetical protein
MQIELIENPLILARRNARTITLALQDHQGSSCAVRGDSVNGKTKSTEEQIRLLLSWRAVLGEIGSSELGAGQW